MSRSVATLLVLTVLGLAEPLALDGASDPVLAHGRVAANAMPPLESGPATIALTVEAIAVLVPVVPAAAP